MTTETLLRAQDFDLSIEDVVADPAFHSEFPQVDLPFQITIGGLTMEGISISLTKALASGRLPPDLEYQDELVSLRFDFDGFSITLFADAILSQDVNDPSAPVSVFFTHPTDGHLSPLRYLINSYVAGDTVTLGQLLSTGTGPGQIKTHAAAPIAKPKRKLWRVGVLAVLGFLFGFLATDMIYQRVLLSTEPRPLVISPEVQTLRATASGQLALINPQAGAGDVAFSLLTNRGELVSLRMPCACDATLASGAFEGATVLSGDPILDLTPANAVPLAQARLSQKGLARFLAGDQAEVVFANGGVLPVALQMDTSQPTPTATVLWPAGASLPDEGSVARLRFNKLEGRAARALKAQLTSISTRLTTLF